MPTAIEPEKPAAKARRQRRRFPPVWIWLVIALLASVILWVHRPEFSDHAIAHIVMLIAAFLSLLLPLIWFSFFSDYSRPVRMAPLVALAVLIAAAAAAFKIDHLNGEMVPSFRLRWRADRDQTLEKPTAGAERSTADLLTTSDDDFPQFLGPTRSAVVEGVKLSRDWQAHPPRRLWQREIGAGWSAFSVVNGFAVTLEQRGDDELVACYDLKTGKPRWADAVRARHRTISGGIGPRSTPTIHAGKVYALGATGILRCLDGANGKKVWTKNIPQEYGLSQQEDEQAVAWGRAASPLVVGDLVIVPAGGAKDRHVSLVAYDKDSGQMVWEGGEEQISYSSPGLATLDSFRQIIIVSESTVSGHDPDTGKVLWRHAWPGRSNANPSASQAVQVAAGRLLLTKGYGGGAMLLRLSRQDDRWSTEELWHQPAVMKTKFTNVAVNGGFAFGLSDGILECIEIETGKRRWKSGRYGHGQLLRVGDLLLIQAESGEVVLVEANSERHIELSRLQALEGQTWNNPALAGRYLLVRNAEQAACYELALADE
jgi:outer membrane protein assembly factor BamB